MSADPFAMLKSDHRQVERLLEQLSDTEPGAERDELVEQVSAALSLHMEFEEAEIYPLTRELVDEEEAEEAEVEHGLARDGLRKLSELSGQAGFDAAVAMVKAGIGHHVEEEEGEMFPELADQISDEQQQDLARQLVVAKRDAGLLTSTLEDASKDDLANIAAILDLDARPSMSKADLRKLVETAGG